MKTEDIFALLKEKAKLYEASVAETNYVNNAKCLPKWVITHKNGKTQYVVNFLPSFTVDDIDTHPLWLFIERGHHVVGLPEDEQQIEPWLDFVFKTGELLT